MRAPTALPELLTHGEVEALLRCAPRTLRAYRDRGQLRAIKLNQKRHLYRRVDVEAFLAARTHGGAGGAQANAE